MDAEGGAKWLPGLGRRGPRCHAFRAWLIRARAALVARSAANEDVVWDAATGRRHSISRER